MNAKHPQRPRLTIADFALKPDLSSLAIPTPTQARRSQGEQQITRNGSIVIRPDLRSWRDHAPKYRPGYVAPPSDEDEPPKS